MNITESNILLKKKSFQNEKHVLLSKEWNGRWQCYQQASVKNFCETKYQWNWHFRDSFSFQLNSLLWWETLLKPIHYLNYLLRGHRKRKCHLPKGFLSTHSYHLPSNEDLAREPGRSLTSAAQTKRTQSFPTKTLAQHSFSEGRALLKWGQQGWRNYLIYSQSNALYSATENHIFQYSHITILGRDFEKKNYLVPFLKDCL